MLIETITQLFERDLEKAAGEIEKYSSDEALWSAREGIANSGGNLALHLAGNINHFIGAKLGNSGYVRDRDLEFADKGRTRDELADGLRAAARITVRALAEMTDDELAVDYPEEFLGEIRSTGWVLLHLLTHLNYHLGQINYHRRIVGG